VSRSCINASSSGHFLGDAVEKRLLSVQQKTFAFLTLLLAQVACDVLSEEGFLTCFIFLVEPYCCMAAGVTFVAFRAVVRICAF
jgi:hypothetical protein